ncbi:hypothetical protein L3Y34_003697 [Caenorhabditis briggsae]|uniref:Uncharacterized protein n=1 Tax=Caenorhabditis briggsae TaxID=6238 RepID=A0AAE9D418_CAEBR|nr:hypothetical protein L3Y34_003697 [Caenorhabditis briggsae]
MERKNDDWVYLASTVRDFNEDGRTTLQDLRFWDFGVRGASWTGQRQGFAGYQTLDFGVRGALSARGFYRLGTSTPTTRIHRIAAFRIWS